METTREAYRDKMEAQLVRWSTRLDGFKAKAELASAAARVELLKQVDELEEFERTARKHIADVEASAVETWHRARIGIDQAWNQLSGSIDAIWARIAPDTKTN